MAGFRWFPAICLAALCTPSLSAVNFAEIRMLVGAPFRLELTGVGLSSKDRIFIRDAGTGCPTAGGAASLRESSVARARRICREGQCEESPDFPVVSYSLSAGMEVASFYPLRLNWRGAFRICYCTASEVASTLTSYESTPCEKGSFELAGAIYAMGMEYSDFPLVHCAVNSEGALLQDCEVAVRSDQYGLSPNDTALLLPDSSHAICGEGTPLGGASGGMVPSAGDQSERRFVMPAGLQVLSADSAVDGSTGDRGVRVCYCERSAFTGFGVDGEVGCGTGADWAGSWQYIGKVALVGFAGPSVGGLMAPEDVCYRGDSCQISRRFGFGLGFEDTAVTTTSGDCEGLGGLRTGPWPTSVRSGTATALVRVEETDADGVIALCYCATAVMDTCDDKEARFPFVLGFIRVAGLESTFNFECLPSAQECPERKASLSSAIDKLAAQQGRLFLTEVDLGLCGEVSGLRASPASLSASSVAPPWPLLPGRYALCYCDEELSCPTVGTSRTVAMQHVGEIVVLGLLRNVSVYGQLGVATIPLWVELADATQAVECCARDLDDSEADPVCSVLTTADGQSVLPGPAAYVMHLVLPGPRPPSHRGRFRVSCNAAGETGRCAEPGTPCEMPVGGLEVQLAPVPAAWAAGEWRHAAGAAAGAEAVAEAGGAGSWLQVVLPADASAPSNDGGGSGTECLGGGVVDASAVRGLPCRESACVDQPPAIATTQGNYFLCICEQAAVKYYGACAGWFLLGGVEVYGPEPWSAPAWAVVGAAVTMRVQGRGLGLSDRLVLWESARNDSEACGAPSSSGEIALPAGSLVQTPVSGDEAELTFQVPAARALAEGSHVVCWLPPESEGPLVPIFVGNLRVVVGGRDCIVGPWQSSGDCGAVCGIGAQPFRREVITPAIGSGECSPSSEVRACSGPPCAQVTSWEALPEPPLAPGGPLELRVTGPALPGDVRGLLLASWSIPPDAAAGGCAPGAEQASIASADAEPLVLGSSGGGETTFKSLSFVFDGAPMNGGEYKVCLCLAPAGGACAGFFPILGSLAVEGCEGCGDEAAGEMSAGAIFGAAAGASAACCLGVIVAALAASRHRRRLRKLGRRFCCCCCTKRSSKVAKFEDDDCDEAAKSGLDGEGGAAEAGAVAVAGHDRGQPESEPGADTEYQRHLASSSSPRLARRPAKLPDGGDGDSGGDDARALALDVAPTPKAVESPGSTSADGHDAGGEHDLEQERGGKTRAEAGSAGLEDDDDDDESQAVPPPMRSSVDDRGAWKIPTPPSVARPEAEGVEEEEGAEEASGRDGGAPATLEAAEPKEGAKAEESLGAEGARGSHASAAMSAAAAAAGQAGNGSGEAAPAPEPPPSPPTALAPAPAPLPPEAPAPAPAPAPPEALAEDEGRAAGESDGGGGSDGIRKGAVFIARAEGSIFASPTSWEEIGELVPGQRIVAAGPPEDIDGYAMVPIEPHGAVDIALLDPAGPGGAGGAGGAGSGRGAAVGLRAGDNIIVREDFEPECKRGASRLARGRRGVVLAVAPDGAARCELADGGGPVVLARGEQRFVAKVPFQEGARIVVVGHGFMSDSDAPIRLAPGALGTVAQVDEEGDMLVNFDDYREQQWVFSANIGHLERAPSDAPDPGAAAAAAEAAAPAPLPPPESASPFGALPSAPIAGASAAAARAAAEAPSPCPEPLRAGAAVVAIRALGDAASGGAQRGQLGLVASVDEDGAVQVRFGAAPVELGAGEAATNLATVPLAPGLRVVARQNFKSDTENSVKIKGGQAGAIVQSSEKGDVLVKFDALAEAQWIRAKKLYRLALPEEVLDRLVAKGSHLVADAGASAESTFVKAAPVPPVFPEGARVIVRDGFGAQLGTKAPLLDGQRGLILDTASDGSVMVAFDGVREPQLVGPACLASLAIVDDEVSASPGSDSKERGVMSRSLASEQEDDAEAASAPLRSPLKRDVRVVASKDFRSVSARSVQIVRGQLGTTIEIAPDGRMLIDFDDHFEPQWVGTAQASCLDEAVEDETRVPTENAEGSQPVAGSAEMDESAVTDDPIMRESRIIAVQDFRSSSGRSVRVVRGQEGTAIEIALDGRMLIDFDDHAEPQWVAASQASCIKVRRGHLPPAGKGPQALGEDWDAPSPAGQAAGRVNDLAAAAQQMCEDDWDAPESSPWGHTARKVGRIHADDEDDDALWDALGSPRNGQKSQAPQEVRVRINGEDIAIPWATLCSHLGDGDGEEAADTGAAQSRIEELVRRLGEDVAVPWEQLCGSVAGTRAGRRLADLTPEAVGQLGEDIAKPWEALLANAQQSCGSPAGQRHRPSAPSSSRAAAQASGRMRAPDPGRGALAPLPPASSSSSSSRFGAGVTLPPRPGAASGVGSSGDPSARSASPAPRRGDRSLTPPRGMPGESSEGSDAFSSGAHLRPGFAAANGAGGAGSRPGVSFAPGLGDLASQRHGQASFGARLAPRGGGGPTDGPFSLSQRGGGEDEGFRARPASAKKRGDAGQVAGAPLRGTALADGGTLMLWKGRNEGGKGPGAEGGGAGAGGGAAPAPMPPSATLGGGGADSSSPFAGGVSGGGVGGGGPGGGAGGRPGVRPQTAAASRRTGVGGRPQSAAISRRS